MSKGQRTVSEEKNGVDMRLQDEGVPDPPPETRRTRSGRQVRTPAALLDSEVPVRTPSRRTRKSVIQEAVEESITEVATRRAEELVEEKLSLSAGAESCTTEAAVVHVSGPTPSETVPMTADTMPNKKPRLGSSGKQSTAVPLGKPKSGRVWKDRNKQRFSVLLRDKPLCSSWEKKMQAKREKDLVKQYTVQLKEEKAKQKEEKRKRREDNLKRRLENERKAEIVQVIKNTAKIKRMKKKHLRKIEKRDTLSLLQKSRTQSEKAKGPKSVKSDKNQSQKTVR
ncbi:coiled-coil domain-containing protein 86 [Labrus bergylta]|uniref:coiled-coil domain-containing protein 86 n=1 Tax=Labrus bergylta TaxID=56723 RepID=UPI003313A301